MSLHPIKFELTIDTSKFSEGMRQAKMAMEKLGQDLAGSGKIASALRVLALVGRRRPDKHHPEPLAFHGRPFGAEYARRRKARGRRG